MVLMMYVKVLGHRCKPEEADLLEDPTVQGL